MDRYFDAAVAKLISIGLSESSAREILKAIIDYCEYAPHVFDDFAEDPEDDWYNQVKYK